LALKLMANEVDPHKNLWQLGYVNALRDIRDVFQGWYRANPTLYPNDHEYRTEEWLRDQLGLDA
jgi:hypothetical protein